MLHVLSLRSARCAHLELIIDIREVLRFQYIGVKFHADRFVCVILAARGKYMYLPASLSASFLGRDELDTLTHWSAECVRGDNTVLQKVNGGDGDGDGEVNRGPTNWSLQV